MWSKRFNSLWKTSHKELARGSFIVLFFAGALEMVRVIPLFWVFIFLSIRMVIGILAG